MIKMDIEGLEYAALRGAKRSIEKYGTGLAVCLYHRPEHLWQIPLYITNVFGGELYLRLHGHSAFDVVAYRIPMKNVDNL